jgi:hypothetical protein
MSSGYELRFFSRAYSVRIRPTVTWIGVTFVPSGVSWNIMDSPN